MNYHLPITPSGGRVYAWRKLKELGAVYLRQGVAVLPYSPGNLHRLQPLATKLRTMGGQCVLTEMRFVEEQDHQQMVDTFKQQSENEFRQLLLDAVQLCDRLGSGDDKTMHKRYIKAKSRDYFDMEEELGAAGLFGELFADLNMEGGWSELLTDLRNSYKDVGKLLAGLLPEPKHKPEERNEHPYDEINC